MLDRLHAIIKDEEAAPEGKNTEKLNFIQEYFKKFTERDKLLEEPAPDKNLRKHKEPFTWRILSFFNFLTFTISIMAGTYMMRIHSKLSSYMSVVEGYDRGGLFQTVAVVQFTTGLIAIMGFCMSNSTLHKRRHGSGHVMLFAHMVWIFGMSMILVSTIYMCHRAFQDLDDNFEGGFYMSMLRYESDKEISIRIDDIQKDFKCCGNLGPAEWFKVSWDDMIPDDKRGVPRSCCDTSKFPAEECVSFEDIIEKDSLSIYYTGCLDGIKKKYRQIFNICFSTLSLLLSVQMICFALGIFNIHWVRNYRKIVLRERLRHLAKVLDYTEAGQKFLSKLQSKEESELGSDILNQ